MTVFLEEAVREMALLGVEAVPCWAEREGSLRPGVAGGNDTYTINPACLQDEEQAADWALIVAALVRGIEA